MKFELRITLDMPALPSTAESPKAMESCAKMSAVIAETLLAFSGGGNCVYSVQAIPLDQTTIPDATNRRPS